MLRGWDRNGNLTRPKLIGRRDGAAGLRERRAAGASKAAEGSQRHADQIRQLGNVDRLPLRRRIRQSRAAGQQTVTRPIALDAHRSHEKGL